MSRVKQLNSLLPLVAIGTIADCQSVLQPTNRLLVKAGLDILQKGQYQMPGLKELLIQTGLQEKLDQGYKLTSQDLGYLLSPILNSSGRVSHANLSIGLICQENESDNQTKAQEIRDMAGELILTNNLRKQMVKDILKDVETAAKAQIDGGRRMIWLSGNYPKGIVGLLASRLVNQYGVPVVVVAEQDEDSGQATASLRAPEGYHLPAAMSAAGVGLFSKFGGHPGAAGFTAPMENLNAIQSGLEASFASQADTENGQHETYLDPADLPKELEKLTFRPEIIHLDNFDLDQPAFDLVWQMDPYGQDFPFPQFLVRLPDGYETRIMGSAENHARLSFGPGLSAVAFNLEPELISALKNQTGQVWLLVKANQNTWNGATKTELIAEKVWVL